jgi:ferredoxin
MSARINYDANRCQSTGVCEVTAAELFLLDDEGIPQFDPDVAPEHLAAARAAAQACPVQALSVSES